jgi:hypothetical protein
MRTKRASWPPFDRSARVRELAVAKISDLTADPGLRAVLARRCADAAQHGFENPAPIVGAVAFMVRRSR